MLKYILVIILLYLVYTLKPCQAEPLSNLSSPSTPINAIFQRHARYDPYYFPYTMDQCYLGIHHNGKPIGVKGRENWNSKTFKLIPNGDYYLIKTSLGSYLYADNNFDVQSDTPTKFSDKYNWRITLDQLRNTVIKNKKNNWYLALSCKTDNVYMRIDYHNDCLFRATSL